MKTITTGGAFTDIDAFASAVAYAELLRLQGKSARAVLPGSLNASIPGQLRNLDVVYEREHTPTDDETFIVVDISEPEYIAKFVDEERIEEIIDHHPGMERYWREKLGEKSDIEVIGAVCTQIVERWERAGRLADMSQESATLLAAGILDNTLNFTAKITMERDRAAYRTLLAIAELPENWAAQYFSWCQAFIEQHIEAAICTDTKMLALAGFEQDIMIGQLAIWDAKTLQIPENLARVFGDRSAPWCLNVLSLANSKNYIWCDDEDLRSYLEKTLDAQFEGGVMTTDRLWLRREVMQRAIDRYEGDV